MVAVGPYSWNSSITAVQGDAVTMDVRAKWMHYLDDVWRPIVPTFALDSGKYTHTTSPWSIEAPPLATGRIKLFNDQSYNPHSRSPFTVSTTPTLELDHPDASPVEPYFDPAKPSQVWYLDALGDGVDLGAGIWPARYPRAEHLVRIRKMPAGGASSVTITERIYTPMSMAGGWNGEATDIGTTGAILLPAGVGDTGIVMRPAVAWYYDTEGNYYETPISVIVERRLGAGYVMLSKIIPTWFIAAAIAAGGYVLADETTTTYYPDADAETTSVDGYAGRSASSETYATIRAGAGVYADASTSPVFLHYLSTNATTNSRFRDMARGILLFDTGSVLAEYTVTDVTLEVYTTAVVAFGSAWTSRIVTSTPASNTSLTASDYQQASTTIKDLGGLSSGSISADAYCLWNLATDSVTKGGITKLGGRSAGDITGSAEFTVKGLANGHQFQTAEGANPPKLTVTYTGGGGGGGSSNNLLLLGVG